MSSEQHSTDKITPTTSTSRAEDENKRAQMKRKEKRESKSPSFDGKVFRKLMSAGSLMEAWLKT